MPEAITGNKICLIESGSIPFRQPLILECGTLISEFTPSCGTCPEPNANASSEILICHAPSGNHNIANSTAMVYGCIQEAIGK